MAFWKESEDRDFYAASIATNALVLMQRTYRLMKDARLVRCRGFLRTPTPEIANAPEDSDVFDYIGSWRNWSEIDFPCKNPDRVGSICDVFK